jgi:hypothetical protein
MKIIRSLGWVLFNSTVSDVDHYVIRKLLGSGLQIVTALIMKTMYNLLKHVKWIPCHHGMARPQFANRGDALQMRRVAVDILNKQ